jgi:hypothetical protein
MKILMYFKWVKLHSRVEKTGKRTPTHWFEIAAEAVESGSQASFAFFIIANWAHFAIENSIYGKLKRSFWVCAILAV